MELLANYDDGSSTPKTERNGEDSNTNMAAEYARMMSAFEMDSVDVDNSEETKAASPQTNKNLPWLSKASDASSSESESSSGEESGSDDEETSTKPEEKAARKGSQSTDYSSDSSSGSGDSKKDVEAVKPVEAPQTEVKESRTASTSSTSSIKAPSRRRSRSASKDRKRRRSSDRRRRSGSRSKDRRHRHHRSERKPSHRSRSRSKDRHSKRRSSKDRHRRDGHRRRPSGSHGDSHRRRHRRPSSHRRRRRSRSPESKKRRSEKPHRSRSRSPKVEKRSKVEEGPSGVKVPVFRTAGLKFGRGRGSANGFKEQLRKEFVENCSAIQTAVSANPNQPAVVPSLMKSNVCTSSAGLGIGMGGLTSAILNQMQQAQKMAGQTLPGGLTQEQMMINQRAILQATGRTKEQVEAETGMKVPEYYNEVNFNVKEWAEREKKRKTLFKKKTEDTKATNQFSAKALLPGADQAQADKFSRLLGVKKHQAPADQSPEQKNQEEQVEAERQGHLMEDLSKSYDSARVYTHLARGSGLGYSNTMYQPMG